MRTRRLGHSDLDITVIGFGAWAIGGGDWLFGWGPQDDADSVATIRRALDLGINWVDTAAVYGLGHSEQVVATRLGGDPRGPAALRLHEVEPGLGPGPQGLAQPAGRFHPSRSRGQPAAPRRRGHRPLSDSLAALGQLARRLGPGLDRRGLAGDGRPAEGRQGPLHRRVQFHARRPGARRRPSRRSRACSRPTRCSGARPSSTCFRGVSSTAPA